MSGGVILASGSKIRAELLRRAGVHCEISPARVDEQAIIASLLSDEVSPDQIADALAAAKAEKASRKFPDAFTLGCDQILSMDDEVFQKAEDIEAARIKLRKLSGKLHHLYSAAVIYLGGEPQWRYTGHVRLKMRELSDEAIDRYLDKTWDRVRNSVGCYNYEEEGIQLFSHVEGNYFHILGLPLPEILDYLIIRKEIEL